MNRNWYIINKLFHRFVKPYYQIIQKAVINKKYPIQQQRYLNSQKYRDWCQNNSESKIIVSLTSMPQRINTVHLVIESIMNQSIKPDKIVLCLIKSEFGDECKLPENLLSLLSERFEIIWGETNLKPHNKYYYAMKKYPYATIITVDDDCFYKKNLIKDLVHAHSLYPKEVICTRAHCIKCTKDRVMEYKDWDYETLQCYIPSNLICATGVGGVLYPAGCLPKETFNKQDITRLCLNADDIWLKCMEILNNTKVICIKRFKTYPVGINHAEEAVNLMSDNVYNNRNDVFLKKVMDNYKIGVDKFLDE